MGDVDQRNRWAILINVDASCFNYGSMAMGCIMMTQDNETTATMCDILKMWYSPMWDFKVV